jgi:hypothetical protein
MSILIGQYQPIAIAALVRHLGKCPFQDRGVFKAAKIYSKKGNSLVYFGVTRKVVAPVFVILMVQQSNLSDLIWLRYDQNGRQTPAI